MQTERVDHLRHMPVEARVAWARLFTWLSVRGEWREAMRWVLREAAIACANHAQSGPQHRARTRELASLWLAGLGYAPTELSTRIDAEGFDRLIVDLATDQQEGHTES